MEIKTIVALEPDDFDEQVNDYMSEGFQLLRREILVPHTGTAAHYAQLVKYDAPAEPDPVGALEIIRETCAAAKDCAPDGCPVYGWCNHPSNAQAQPPKHWAMPGEVGSV